MKKGFYKMIFKYIFPDFFEFLTVNINADVNTHDVSRHEIYTDRGNYSEIVGMQRGTKLIKRFLRPGKFDGLAYESKIKLNRRNLATSKQSF